MMVTLVKQNLLSPNYDSIHFKITLYVYYNSRSSLICCLCGFYICYIYIYLFYSVFYAKPLLEICLMLLLYHSHAVIFKAFAKLFSPEMISRV